jgi:PPOX class probable F420-dependent enzyme
MKYCPNRQCPFLLENKIPSEFRDDIEFCPDCGTRLAEGEAPAMEPDPLAGGDLRTLCTVQFLEDAEYLQENLTQHDVVASILTRAELQARNLYVDEIGEYGLVVLESEYVRANRILDLILEEDADEEAEEHEDLGDDEEEFDEEELDEAEWEDEVDSTGNVLADLLQHFSQSYHSWFATVRPDGRPHLTPVWHVWHNGRIYVSTRSETVKAANVQTNPHVALAANEDDPDDGLLIEGTATLRTELRDEITALFARKYEWLLNTRPDHDVLLEITPTKVIAWGQYGEGRWLADEIREAATLL